MIIGLLSRLLLRWPAHLRGQEDINVGDILSIDFNSALLHVIKKNRSSLKLRVITGGKVGSNKAVSINRNVYLNSLTKKDMLAIKIGLKNNDLITQVNGKRASNNILILYESLYNDSEVSINFERNDRPQLVKVVIR